MRHPGPPMVDGPDWLYRVADDQSAWAYGSASAPLKVGLGRTPRVREGGWFTLDALGLVADCCRAPLTEWTDHRDSGTKTFANGRHDLVQTWARYPILG